MPPIEYSAKEKLPPTLFDNTRRDGLLLNFGGWKLTGLEGIVKETVEFLKEKGWLVDTGFNTTLECRI